MARDHQALQGLGAQGIRRQSPVPQTRHQHRPAAGRHPGHCPPQLEAGRRELARLAEKLPVKGERHIRSHGLVQQLGPLPVQHLHHGGGDAPAGGLPGPHPRQLGGRAGVVQAPGVCFHGKIRTNAHSIPSFPSGA